MKAPLSFLASVALLVPAWAADPITPNLQALTADQGVKLYRITTEWSADAGGKPALKLRTTPGEDGLVVLGGITFTNGIIEFDARGKSGPPQSNFIGVAIRVVDGTHYDHIYFRPFNFRTPIEERRIHAVQYASLPEWPWPRLRSERAGQFEKPIEPAPDGDAWFHAKIVVQKPKVSVFVDGAKEPSLVVEELTARTGGSVALWCNGFGSLANLKITPANINQ
jgi:hypothetical protein